MVIMIKIARYLLLLNAVTFVFCCRYDRATVKWRSGRNGRLTIPKATSDIISITVSNDNFVLKIYCFQQLSKTGLTYKFRMKDWCKKRNGKYKSGYTMQYNGGYSKITSIIVDSKDICAAVKTTKAPTSTTLPTTPKPITSCNEVIQSKSSSPSFRQITFKILSSYGTDSGLLEIKLDGPLRQEIYSSHATIIRNEANTFFRMKVDANYMERLRKGNDVELAFDLRYSRTNPAPKVLSITFNSFSCPNVKQTTTAPKITTAAPEITTEAPKVTTEAPEITTKAPKITTEAPEITTEAPKITTKAPAITTKAPEITTKAPEITTEAPKITTEVPKITTKAPEITTEAPEITTEAPKITTDAPEITTEAPDITTEAPEITTKAREITTKAPEITTKAPEITTEAPTITTKAPEITTEAPELTTNSPEITTETPEATTKVTTKLPTTAETITTTTGSTTGSKKCTPKYNYSEALSKSLLFYEAQRSGTLPASNRIPWRQSATVNDGSEVGKDLSGGYFDAGDHVKFNFPMASTITMLSWGMIEYPDGYKFAGEYQHGLDAIKWGTDYFLKCHTGPNEFWGQVGDGNTDHAIWGRASELKISRPCFVINANKPGSDLAGEVAASLAASSIVFKNADPSYSNTLLQHAKEMYDFGNIFRGKYSDSIPNASQFYNSYSGFMDELAWAAAWLYKATGEAKYLTDAESHYNYMQQDAKEFSWDNKGRGVAILLASITKSTKYQTNGEGFCSWLRTQAEKTPQGMVFLQPYGSNRHAANVAFACLVLSKHFPSNDNKDFARKQIHLLLGDPGRSYVVGFGNNPPTQPHHRGASCPNRPAPCGWNEFNSQGPNPQTLAGALVGGPDKNGNYQDKRSDYVMNEITIDYNAGYQSALAGLLQAQSNNECDGGDGNGDGVTTTSKPSITLATFSPITVPKKDIEPQCGSKYDYSDVIRKSLLFYEAQRSGTLPPSNRIPWRKTSTEKDGSTVGKDLTGGYFDAGDYVKFNFPGASTITMLAWGMVEFSDGYHMAGEYENSLAAIKWATDYFVKCHTDKNEFWAQVGNGVEDHKSWGRATELGENRPCYKIDSNNPGSDLAGEVAAALAASYMVFYDADINYANMLLQHSKELYEFANTHRGKYSDSIADAAKFYNSYSGYMDELAWAAVWLHRATGEQKYLTDAEQHYNTMQQDPNEVSWDNKGRVVGILLASLTNGVKYITNANSFCTWLKDTAPKTPLGMVFLQKWGSNRHAANVAFACLALSKHFPSLDFTEFSRKQVHLLLGDAGRSYVVGFGNNPPMQPHHSGSSCPNRPASCGWNDFNNAGPNPNILYGALVGGPDQAGNYEDKRNDYVKNEVAIDYNAGFQSAVAGLAYLQSKGKC